MQVKFSTLLENVLIALEAGLVPMITSPPGIGKSSLGRLIAEMANLEYIDIRLTNYNITSLNGFPSVDRENNVSDFIPMAEIPIAGRDTLPKGKDGWLINFDELTSCTPPMQAAAYKIILDRYLGSHKLHEDVHMMACGNGLRDGAVVNRMSTALQSRMVHYQLMSNLDAFIENAIKKNFHHTVIDFVQFKPELLNNFEPDHSDFTYACERTWEMLSKVMHTITDLNHIHKYVPTLEGTVGYAAATEFIGFLRVFDRIPKWSEIENAPDTTSVPSEPSVRAAMCQIFVDNVDKKNLNKVIEYIQRMPPENQLMICRRICMKDKTFARTPAMQKIQQQFAANYDYGI